jgi:CRP/FNR family cyclic AMP-dependent transcriptional regulator
LVLADERVGALKRVGILQNLSDEALENLARICRWQAVASGQLIVSANDPSDDVYFVASGKVRVILYSASEGRPVLFTTLGPGEMFGDVAAIDGKPRSATVEAEENCRLASLTSMQFQRLILSEPSVCLAAMQRFAGIVRRLSDRIFEMSTLGVQGRVYAELLRLATIAERETGQPLLSPAPPLIEVASRISTHREAVSRAVSRLTGAEVVRREGGDLRILDMERLRELVREAHGD